MTKLQKLEQSQHFNEQCVKDMAMFYGVGKFTKFRSLYYQSDVLANKIKDNYSIDERILAMNYVVKKYHISKKKQDSCLELLKDYSVICEELDIVGGI